VIPRGAAGTGALGGRRHIVGQRSLPVGHCR
jgi:hypothetical protein